MQSFYSLLYSSLSFKRFSRSALPAYYSSHTTHLLNKLKTESDFPLGSNTAFVNAKFELLQSFELDTHCFLNKFYKDNPGVNEIYNLIRSLKTMYLLLPDEMVRLDKNFKGNKEMAFAITDFFCEQFVKDGTQEVCDFSETTYNSLDFNINLVCQNILKL